MRKHFKNYYTPNKEELKKLWQECIFCFDTSALLDVYSYSSATADKVIEAIEINNDRIWLPYHVGYEYQRNRPNRISDEIKSHSETIKKVEEIIADLEKQRHPFVNENTLKVIKTALEELDKRKNEHVALFKNDKYRDRLTDIFDGKVGDSFSEEELEGIYREGDSRFKKEIPPGYADKTKNTNKYGDLIVWKQIIKKAIDEKKDIILVTSDNKEDWWNKHSGMTFGPRPELLDEFQKETRQNIYLYKPPRFIELTEIKNSEKAIKEVERVQESRERATNDDIKDFVTRYDFDKIINTTDPYDLNDLNDLNDLKKIIDLVDPSYDLKKIKDLVDPSYDLKKIKDIIDPYGLNDLKKIKDIIDPYGLNK